MYFVVCTRPDTAYAVSVLGRYLANPGNEHWVGAKKKKKRFYGIYRKLKTICLYIEKWMTGK